MPLFARLSMIVLTIAAVLPVRPAGAIELVAHKAVYEMRLLSASPASGVAGVTGEMVYRFDDGCDGWTVELGSALIFTTTTAEQPLVSEWSLVSWEAKDGARYRFRMKAAQNGAVQEELEGTAEVGAKGGSVTFAVPERTVVPLPEGTLFPNAHTVYMLERFAKGGKMFDRPVFDGTEAAGALRVSSLLLKTLRAGEAGEIPGAPLLSGQSWRAQVAFFPFSTQGKATPDMEMHLRYHDNGVAEEVIQNYGDFRVRAVLKSLEILPKPDC